MSALNTKNWKVSYRHEDGNLVELFYVPALSSSVSYDRMTGYFSATALALAGRGIDGLIVNRGRMRLIVGCTLEEPESAAIAAGYDFRSRMEAQLAAVSLEPPDKDAHDALALLWRLALCETKRVWVRNRFLWTFSKEFCSVSMRPVLKPGCMRCQSLSGMVCLFVVMR
jgi:hypothetical protein